jgi:4-amino-4-deoxy-L-arabinose transferase-like glycosyltransferase
MTGSPAGPTGGDSIVDSHPFYARVRQRLSGGLSGRRGHFVALGLLTLLAAALRFYKLGAWGFWRDEVFTIGLYEDGFNYNLWRSSSASALIQMTVRALGTSEWSARLVPALVGVMSVPVLYFGLRRMIGRGATWIALLLLAVAPWHLYWSQNARFYTLLLLFYTLALSTAFIGFEEDRPWHLLLSLLLLGLAARERLLALFFVPVIISYLLLVRLLPLTKPAGLRLRNLAIYFGPAVLCTLFFVTPYVRNLTGWMAGFGFSNNSPFWLLAGVIYYIGIPVAGLAAAGAVYEIRLGNRAALLLTLSAIIPLLILMAIAPFHYTANRYAFISLTSWLALAAMALHRLMTLAGRRAALLTAAVLLVVVASSLGEDVLYFRVQNGNRDNWRAAFAYIQTHAEPGDRIVSADKAVGDYYLAAETTNLDAFRPDDAAGASARTWFVEDMTAAIVFPQKLAWIQANARQVADFDVHVHARTFRMRVYLYDPGVR